MQASGISTGKTVTGTDPDYYKNTSYGVAFNVNDSLSISYAEHESEQHFVQPGSNEAINMDVESWQVAYTMGGASIRLMRQDIENQTYSAATTADFEATIVSLGLAF